MIKSKSIYVDNIEHRAFYQLSLIRSLAIFFQIVTLLINEWFFQVSLPLFNIIALIAIYLLIHLSTYQYLKEELKEKTSIPPNTVFILLAIDVLFLDLLLYYAGGASNPLITLLLFPLTITASLFATRYTWLMSIICIGSYTTLMFFYRPLPHNHAEGDEFNLHILGMWLGFILSAALISIFIVAIKNALRQKDRLLNQAKEQNLKDKQIISLATLTASTAHELGTPLASIALLSEELEIELSDPILQKELISPLRQQVKRCKEILSTLTAATSGQSQEPEAINCKQYLEGVVLQWQQNTHNSNLQFKFSLSQYTQILVDKTLTQAIHNLLDNAWKVSLIEQQNPELELLIEEDNRSILITINDQGPGIEQSLLADMGKQPFAYQTDSHNDGMGLGLFLSYAIIERLGGDIQLNNIESGGLSTTINLPKKL